MSKHIIEDAKRCLQCKTPQCSVGCPLFSPIRDAIHHLLDNNIAEAGRILFENNPLSIICCHVCPQEDQCEGHCVMGKTTGTPVQISAIEQYISDFYLNIYNPVPSKKTAGKVAIIGSGPAGFIIAFILSKMDYDITIYEGSERIGGVMRYGIPEFRLPKRYLDKLADVLNRSGVVTRPNTTIGPNLTIDDLFRDGYEAIFMGTGVWRPQKMNVKGESFGNVHYAIDYLRNPDVYRLGERLAIVGAGNVAMDVARTAIRHGCHDVTILCNMDESAITARPIEVQYAGIDGAKIRFNKTVVEFRKDGVLLAESDVRTDEQGNKVVSPLMDTLELFPADSMIIAIGQRPRAVVVSTKTGIDLTDTGLVAVDDYGRTSHEGIFASGDVVTGAKTVVEAVRVSKRVAGAIHDYIREKHSRMESAE